MLDSIRNKAGSFGTMVIFGIIIVVFVFWGIGNFGGVSSRNLATVNGEAISISEFLDAANRAAEARKKTDPDLLENADKFKLFKREVLSELIKARLTLQEAERLGMLMTPQELRLALESFSVFHDASGKFNKDVYLQVLNERELDPGVFEQDFSDELLERKLIRYIGMSANVSEAEARNLYAFTLEKRRAEYVLFEPDEYLAKAEISEEEARRDYEAGKESFRTPQMAAYEYVRLTPASLAGGYPVSDAEAEAYYQQNIESFRKADRFLARHIFISFPLERQGGQPLDQREKEAAAKELMAKVQAELKAGKDFAELAQQYSHDEVSARNGGLLEWMERGLIPIKEFEDAAFALKPGEVSQPVKSDAGLHLIKLEKKEDAHLPAFAQVREEILSKLATQKADADFHNVQKAAEDGLALNTPLQDLAARFKVPVEKIALMAEKEAEQSLSLKDDSRQLLQDAVASAAVSGVGKEASGNATAGAVGASGAMTIPVPLNIEGGIALVTVTEAVPSLIPPFEEVRDTVVSRLKAERARVLAREDAEKALPAFTGSEAPEAYKSKVQTSQDAVRAFPLVEPLGNSEALLQGLFSSNGEWLPAVYDTPKGPVIARSAAVQPVTDEDWNKWKGIFIPQMQEARRNEVLAAFMLGLDERSKVEANLEQLDSLSLSRRMR